MYHFNYWYMCNQCTYCTKSSEVTILGASSGQFSPEEYCHIKGVMQYCHSPYCRRVSPHILSYNWGPNVKILSLNASAVLCSGCYHLWCVVEDSGRNLTALRWASLPFLLVGWWLPCCSKILSSFSVLTAIWLIRLIFFFCYLFSMVT